MEITKSMMLMAWLLYDSLHIYIKENNLVNGWSVGSRMPLG